ncbi:MAG: sigma-70 family RNA polymerase sigma factor [Candidatus Omnitrophota bacterium]
MISMTTEQLIQKCIDNDHVAWNEFVRRYKGLVTRSVRSKLKKLNVRLPGGEFHDIVQEIFLSIWEKGKLAGVRDISCVEAWLVIMALNKTFNYCKSKTFRTERGACSLDEEINRDKPWLTLGAVLPSAKFDTEKNIESNELKEMLEKEISGLNPRQQLALKLNIYDGKTQKDIAQIMNIPENTVGTMIKRSKDKIREALEPYIKE